MRRYGQYCPVAKAAEILAERWTPLILRELLFGSSRFSELQRGIPLISRAVLIQRLHELEDCGVIERRPGPRGPRREYVLTSAGTELREIIERMGEWGQRWARKSIERGELDAGFLMWDIHRRVNIHALPLHRVVVEFVFRGIPRDHRAATVYWLVLNRPEVDLCLKPTGHNVDLIVKADLRALTAVWMGDITLLDARRSSQISMDGPRELVRSFPRWLAFSPFASVPRPVPRSA